MVRPSPALYGRLRFTTKQVGRGFYRGNRTGAMGAHTEFGGYVIDWRKTAHFNVPETTGFRLTPFVSTEMEPTPRVETRPDGVLYTPEKIDALEFLKAWKMGNPGEYEAVTTHQRKERLARMAAEQQSIEEMSGEAESLLEQDAEIADAKTEAAASESKSKQ